VDPDGARAACEGAAPLGTVLGAFTKYTESHARTTLIRPETFRLHTPLRLWRLWPAPRTSPLSKATEVRCWSGEPG